MIVWMFITPEAAAVCSKVRAISCALLNFWRLAPRSSLSGESEGLQITTSGADPAPVAAHASAGLPVSSA